MEKRVVLGMSGGVDSAAAALLLKREGFAVEGVMLRLWGEADSADAGAVCDALGIPLTVLDGREEFRREVVEPFADEYTAGRTPNPCVRCNRHVKLALLARRAEERGVPAVATGHYARMGEAGGRRVILRASHLPKDQSYALCTLPREILDKLILPLGAYTKAEIRALAEKAGLPVAAKAESQDICFVPDGDYAAFLEELRPGRNPPGRFRSPDGGDLGPHRGLWHYTVGQRKGLGIALGSPAFVRRIDAATGDVILSDGAALFSDTLRTGPIQWMDRDALEKPGRFTVKLRYGARPAEAVVSPEENGVTITFFEPQRAVTPGQSAALYSGEVLCGGGVILG